MPMLTSASVQLQHFWVPKQTRRPRFLNPLFMSVKPKVATVSVARSSAATVGHFFTGLCSRVWVMVPDLVILKIARTEEWGILESRLPYWFASHQSEQVAYLIIFSSNYGMWCSSSSGNKWCSKNARFADKSELFELELQFHGQRVSHVCLKGDLRFRRVEESEGAPSWLSHGGCPTFMALFKLLKAKSQDGMEWNAEYSLNILMLISNLRAYKQAH